MAGFFKRQSVNLDILPFLKFWIFLIRQIAEFYKIICFSYKYNIFHCVYVIFYLIYKNKICPVLEKMSSILCC